jgi:hypothetical protein
MAVNSPDRNVGVTLELCSTDRKAETWLIQLLCSADIPIAKFFAKLRWHILC